MENGKLIIVIHHYPFSHFHFPLFSLFSFNDNQCYIIICRGGLGEG